MTLPHRSPMHAPEGPCEGGDDRRRTHPRLNTLETVEGIVREYVAEAIRRWAEGQSQDWVIERTKQLNATFLGGGCHKHDGAIYVTGPWNTPDLIGAYCLHAFHLSGEHRYGPMLALMQCAMKVLSIVAAHQGEEPEAYGKQMVRLIERTRNVLLGLPPDLHTVPLVPLLKVHPKANDLGEPVPLKHPHAATLPSTWADPQALATFTPGGPTPKALNGIPLAPWADHPIDPDDWNDVQGLTPPVEEPPLPESTKAQAAGVVIEEPDGRVWIVHPSNAFGGAKATFPKRRVQEGIDTQPSAIQAAYEEAGLQIELTAYLCDVERTTTCARYYLARRLGGTPIDCGWQSQAVSLVPKERLLDVLNLNADQVIATELELKQTRG